MVLVMAVFGTGGGTGGGTGDMAVRGTPWWWYWWWYW